MSGQDDLSKYTPNCATEVLLKVFSYLKPYHLIKCRQVCSRWKSIVDSLCTEENLWKRSCLSDFPDIYLTAYLNSMLDLSWRNLYRSLSLWSKLHSAVVTLGEIAPASQDLHEIREFSVLRGGEIGVNTRGGIDYYSITTLQPSNRRCRIQGDYTRYVENNDVVVVLGLTMHLYVIRKFRPPPQHEIKLIPSVKHFLLHHSTLYYATMNNEIHMCYLSNENITCSLLVQMSENVMCLAYKEGLHVLTHRRNIYTIFGETITLQNILGKAPNMFYSLYEYNFLDHYQWMFTLRHCILQGDIHDVTVIKVYGDMVFVGLETGVLRIYHSRYINKEFNLFNTQPIKEYNFFEHNDYPMASCIIQIDVIEGIDSHMVLVAMRKKIAVLNFSHEY